MNRKGIAVSIATHLAIAGLAWIILQIELAADVKQADAWPALIRVMIFVYSVSIGGQMWAAKQAQWAGPRVREMSNFLVIGISLTVALFSSLAFIEYRSSHRMPAGLFMAVAMLVVTWAYSTAFEGETKYDFRKHQLPIFFTPKTMSVVGKMIIVFSVFPVLCMVFHLLLSLPFTLILMAFHGSARLADAISKFALIPAIIGAFQLCRRIWPKAQSIS